MEAARTVSRPHGLLSQCGQWRPPQPWRTVSFRHYRKRTVTAYNDSERYAICDMRYAIWHIAYRISHIAYRISHIAHIAYRISHIADRTSHIAYRISHI